MKTSRLYCSISLLMSLAVLGQTSLEHKVSNITKGACSPIAPDNQGSITIKCVGFSEEQNKQIVNLLHLLSLKQASDQDALRGKMNELLATVKAAQRQASPRIITEQDRHHIVAPEAAEDIDKLLLYLAENATESVVLETEERIISAFSQLARTPTVGHRRPDLCRRPGVYFFLVKPYLIASQYDCQPIVIYGVLHSAHDVSAFYGAVISDRRVISFDHDLPIGLQRIIPSRRTYCVLLDVTGSRVSLQPAG